MRYGRYSLTKLKMIHVVYADWCPHCVPTTVEPMKKVAEQLGVPYKGYNIETEDVVKADELVRRYGDWSEDYLIPQVFVEFDDGELEHVLTGYPEGVVFTKRAVESFLKSDFYVALEKGG